MTTEKAFNILKQAMIDDPDYAWGWHSNVAMTACDEGLSHKAANQAAARFMYNTFRIDTSQHKNYIYS